MTHKWTALLFVAFWVLLAAVFLPTPILAEDNDGTVSSNGDVTIQQFQEEVLHTVRTEYRSYFGLPYEAYDTTEGYITIYFMNGYALDHTSTSRSATYGSLAMRYYYEIKAYYYRTW